MFCIAGLVLLCSVFVSSCALVSGGNLHCQLTSNIGNNSNTVVVELHQRLIINCSTTQRNSSNLTFEWESKKHPWKKFGVLSILNIPDVAWNHAGRFECVIKRNRSLESCDFTVIVKTLPHVRIKRFDVREKTMIVPCYVTGYFKPNKITWYKNDKQIFPNDTDYFVENLNKTDFLFISNLRKIHPNLNDSGNYSCEARNIYGTSQRTYSHISKSKINGYVHEKCPKFKSKSTVNVTISLGSSTSLLCKVMYTTNMPPYFILSKINNTIGNIGVTKNIYKERNKGNGIKLINFTIVNADRNDSGRYRCDFLLGDDFHCPKTLHKFFNVKVIAFSPVYVNQKKKLNPVMVIAVSVAGALCGVALILYVCHLRRKMKAQLYDSCPDDQPELRWDVFVSYSSHDFAWVDDLCQMLEQPPFNLTVCLHQRDWELGRSLVDNMVDSIYGSHKTLIIVSKHYLQSEYCMQELQLAMHSEIASEHVRKDRIVLIKIDDVSTQRLPRVLRQKSYLDCSDPEHAKHFKTNLLRVLPRRELMEEGPFQEEDKQSSDESNASVSSGEIRLQEWPIV